MRIDQPAVVEGTCLGPPQPVPGTCVTGMDGMTGNGELLCSIVDGVAHASFLEFGESVSYEPSDDDAGAPGPNDALECAEALSRLRWPIGSIPDGDAGFLCINTLGCLPYCGH